MRKHSPMKERDRISDEELSRIREYITQHQTAILVIMFTDIEGFTALTEEKGEQWSGRFRKNHDDILASAIEANGAGCVIKFIGDAVMAVFAEPTAAVISSLRIQDDVALFNNDHPDLPPMKVRIGLHMGQVLVEDMIATDIFGRHVNRAARVESLATGGQILMSDPVFDSARGWLMEDETLLWAEHGRYLLKGISKEVDIYEVCRKGVATPKAPEKGRVRKGRVHPFSIAATLLTLSLTLFLVSRALLSPPSVLFQNYRYEKVVAQGSDTLSVDGKPGDELRRLETPLARGFHLLYFDVSPILRYFAPLTIERGENIVQLAFTPGELPSLDVRTTLSDDAPVQASDNKTRQVFLLSETGTSLRIPVEISAEITGRPVSDSLLWTALWSITVDGETLEGRADRESLRAERSDFDEWEELYRGPHFAVDGRWHTSGPHGTYSLRGRWLSFEQAP